MHIPQLCQSPLGQTQATSCLRSALHYNLGTRRLLSSVNLQNSYPSTRLCSLVSLASGLLREVSKPTLVTAQESRISGGLHEWNRLSDYLGVGIAEFKSAPSLGRHRRRPTVIVLKLKQSVN